MEEKRKRETLVDTDPPCKRMCKENESEYVAENHFEDVLVLEDSDMEDLDTDSSISSNDSTRSLNVKSTNIKRLKLFSWRSLLKSIFPVYRWRKSARKRNTSL